MRREWGHVWKRWERCIKRMGEICGEDGGDVRSALDRCEEREGTFLEKMGEMY